MLARAVFGVLVLVLLVIVAGLPVAAFVIAIIIFCGLLVVPLLRRVVVLLALMVASPHSRGCGSAKTSDIGRLVRKSKGGSPAKTE